jgi:hypothetical protein
VPKFEKKRTRKKETGEMTNTKVETERADQGKVLTRKVFENKLAKPYEEMVKIQEVMVGQSGRSERAMRAKKDKYRGERKPSAEGYIFKPNKVASSWKKLPLKLPLEYWKTCESCDTYVLKTLRLLP